MLVVLHGLPRLLQVLFRLPRVVVVVEPLPLHQVLDDLCQAEAESAIGPLSAWLMFQDDGWAKLAQADLMGEASPG
jgi:hypothetical protein